MRKYSKGKKASKLVASEICATQGDQTAPSCQRHTNGSVRPFTSKEITGTAARHQDLLSASIKKSILHLRAVPCHPGSPENTV